MKAYSYHTFILPFIWEKSGSGKGLRIEDQFAGWQKRFDEDVNWKEMYKYNGESIELPDGIDTKDFYKEYKYFHPHVCESIYGYPDAACPNGNKTENNIVKTYTLMPGGCRINGSYSIEKTRNEEQLRYVLSIDAIEVKLYNTGIGIYLLKCRNDNKNQSNLSSVKDINDYGRRITMPTYENFVCADVLTVDIDGVGTFSEDWSDLRALIRAGNLSSLTYISKTVTGSLGISCDEIDLGIDDRMFVLSWISDPGETAAFLTRKSRGATPEKSYEYPYITDENLSKDLYELVAVDYAGSCSCQSNDMRIELLKKYVYPRWLDWESIYMIAAQGFIALSSADDENTSPFLVDNFNTQYCQLACLCLAQRTTLINFSRRAEEISKGIEQKGDTLSRDERQAMMDLQERFIAFLTQIDTSEASPEEQGIELYDMLRDVLNIEREKETLKEQLNGLNELANTTQDFNFNRAAGAIAIAALVLAVGDLIGNNYFRSDSVWTDGCIFNWFTVIFVLAALVSGIVVYCRNRRRG